MTTRRFGCIDRRRFVASSVIGGAAILTAGHPLRASTTASRPAALLAQNKASDVPMFRGNAARTGEMPGPGLRLDMPVFLKWSYEVGDISNDGPVFFDGKIYVSKEELVHCIDANSGKELWRFESPNQELLFRSPAVADGMVYIGGDSLYAVDAATGQEHWRYELAGSEFDLHPLIDNGTVFAGGSGNGNAVPHFHALDAKTGTEKWRASALGNGITPSFAPAFANGTVFVGDSSYDLVALDAATGQELWRYDPVFDPGEPPKSIAVADKTVYLAALDGGLFAINASTGEESWRYAADGQIDTEITVSNGAVLVASGRGTIVSLDAASGEERWRFAPEDTTLVGCALIDGFVFTQYYGERIVAIDYETGAVDREIPGPDDSAGWMVSGLIAIDGVVYAGWNRWVFALANLPAATLIADTTLRAAPSDSGVEIATLPAGSQISPTGNQEERNGSTWLEVRTDTASGWIPQDSVDPTTLPPADVEIIYRP